MTQPAAAATAGPTAIPATGRLVSLDAYRGFIMLLLISHGFGFSVLAHYPNFSWVARQVDHAAWEGCTFWDLIQPAFTFMVGVAMPFSMARRTSFGAQFRHVAWRALVLIVLSNVLSNWTESRGLQFQLINVLCQIAFGYFLCFLIMQLPFKAQVAAGIAMLALAWGLYAAFPGPQGPFSQSGNIGQVIDRKLLGYNYSGYYTTINFIGNGVTILFGVWAGMLMQRPKTHGYRLKVLGACALAAFAAGLALQPFNPMVKRLWTASFTFFSAGWVLLMLMAFYWLVEVRGRRKWAFPAVVLGMNSIFIYSFGQVLHGWLNRGVANLTGSFWFLGDLGAIPLNFVDLCIMWYLCYWLYKHKIFIRI